MPHRIDLRGITLPLSPRCEALHTRKALLAFRVAEELVQQCDAMVLLSMTGAGDAPLRPEIGLRAAIHSFRPRAMVPASRQELAVLYRFVLSSYRVQLIADDTADVRQALLPPIGSALLFTVRS